MIAQSHEQDFRGLVAPEEQPCLPSENNGFGGQNPPDSTGSTTRETPEVEPADVPTENEDCGLPPALAQASAEMCGGPIPSWLWGEFGNCIYFLLLEGEVVYIGQAAGTMQSRIGWHLADGKQFDQAVRLSAKKKHLNPLEFWLVRALRPRLNKATPCNTPYYPPDILEDYGFGHLIAAITQEAA